MYKTMLSLRSLVFVKFFGQNMKKSSFIKYLWWF